MEIGDGKKRLAEIAGEVLVLRTVMREIGKVGMRDVGYAGRRKCTTTHPVENHVNLPACIDDGIFAAQLHHFA